LEDRFSGAAERKSQRAGFNHRASVRISGARIRQPFPRRRPFCT
jgi:hypothetical protein